jgi:hypothetical protein
MDKTSHLGSTRILSLLLTEHQTSSGALSSAEERWVRYPIHRVDDRACAPAGRGAVQISRKASRDTEGFPRGQLGPRALQGGTAHDAKG